MHKDEYLGDEEVKGFVTFLKFLVNDNGYKFYQEYQTAKPKKTFKFKGVYDSFKQYEWDRNNYFENKKTLDLHKKNLKNAIESSNELGTLVASLQILEWGAGYRGAVGWLANKAENGVLVESLNKATCALNSSDDAGIQLFKNNKILRSDSGMTKIYSLASESSVIYDDRVGAALALFVKHYLVINEIDSVSPLLNFMCGSNKSRNPSDNTYKFKRKETGYFHALSNLRANWILQEIEGTLSTKLWGDYKPKAQRMRVLEAALFMIGYAVDGDRVKDINFKKVIDFS